MKISFKKQDLVNALNISSNAVAQRTTMPILECILLEAYEEGVSGIFSINRVAVPYKEARARARSDLKLTMDNLLRFMKNTAL